MAPVIAGRRPGGTLKGIELMKNLIYTFVILIAMGASVACTSGSSAPTPPPAAAVTGIDTPKSVSVVTAN